MRVGIDARIVYYAPGGIRSYTLHLLDALAQLDDKTEYYILHSRKDRDPPLPGPNFHPCACWTPSHHRLERWTLGLEIARLGLDLLHSPDFIPPKFGYQRSVITIHDLNFLYYPKFLTSESRRYYNQQIEWAIQKTDHILADSYATKNDLVSLLEVEEGKVTVAHLAAAHFFQVLQREEAKRVALHYDLQPGFLLFVGTLEPRKNVPGLLRAYSILLEEEATSAPLVLLGGRGWLYDDIFERVEALNLNEHVRFLHDVPDADLPSLYNAASLLVTPSFYEGFGLPALEAMSCGTPVVVADRASLPEVVGEAGLLVNPDDPADIAQALARVLEDSSLRSQMRAEGLAQAKCFSWEKTAQATLEVYRSVVGEQAIR
jgi:glycosyltransferase involved in cell wall biosynthesis